MSLSSKGISYSTKLAIVTEMGNPLLFQISVGNNIHYEAQCEQCNTSFGHKLVLSDKVSSLTNWSLAIIW